MSLKKFMLSDGSGDLEESELDSSGIRTICYDDTLKKIQISNAYIVQNLNVSGTIFGDGSGITNLSASQISGIISTVQTSNNISGDGTVGNPIILNDNISLNSITASFSGDGSQINNISNSSLQNSSIIINNQTVSLGGSITIETGNSIATPITVKFTKSSGIINIGDIVAVGSSGLSRCDKANNLLSNVIGVVYSSGSNEIEVQVFGEASTVTSGSVSTGSIVYAGINGNAVSYDQIMPGEYITQVGIISGNGPGKIIIQPRIFGQR